MSVNERAVFLSEVAASRYLNDLIDMIQAPVEKQCAELTDSLRKAEIAQADKDERLERQRRSLQADGRTITRLESDVRELRAKVDEQIATIARLEEEATERKHSSAMLHSENRELRRQCVSLANEVNNIHATAEGKDAEIKRLRLALQCANYARHVSVSKDDVYADINDAAAELSRQADAARAVHQPSWHQWRKAETAVPKDRTEALRYLAGDND